MCKILTVYKYHGTAVGVFEPAASKFVDTQNNHFEIAMANGENGVISSVIESFRSGFHCAEVQSVPVGALTGTDTDFLVDIWSECLFTWLRFGYNSYKTQIRVIILIICSFVG